MQLYVLPSLFALFTWWASTGVIMYLDGLPRRTFRWSMLGATLLCAASLWGLWAVRDTTTVAGAYWGFTCGLLAWGWQEISFYMGFVTGPRRTPCPDGCRGWRHFGHAIGTSLWHELAIIAMGAAVVWLTWGGPNQVGTWTFMVLWWMHQSAKLNVFLGVRNLNEEFLPEHLQFLRSFLTKKPMNLLFPVSITVSTAVLVRLVDAAAAGRTRFEAAGFCFLAVLMALAVLEHWLLVLPLPAARLWSWSLSSRKKAATPFAVEVVAGFLGAGKTTLLRARLAGAGPGTVVLVNDFAAVGIDGSLLQGAGAEVVELPNGCICCSLRGDLSRQLSDMAARFSPARVLIEPSGVADLASLLSVLEGPGLRPLVSSLAVTAVVDAGAFGRDYARRGALLGAQLRLATLLVVNKTDLAGPAALRLVEDTVRAANPHARLVRARFGVAAAPGLLEPLARGEAEAHAHGPHDHDGPAHEAHDHHAHGHTHGEHAAHETDRPAVPQPAHAGHAHGDHDHDHAHDHDHPAHPAFDSWSAALEGVRDPERLLALLEQVAAGRFGTVERLKGLAPAAEGWMRFDVAGGRASLAAFAPAAGEVARVVAIGTGLDAAGLSRAFATDEPDASRDRAQASDPTPAGPRLPVPA